MSLTKIGSIGINTGIQFAGVTTVSTLHVGSGVTLSSDGDVFATGISTFSEDIKVGSGVTISPDGDGFYTGVVTATTFSGALSGSGANITAINASNIASGTVPTARLGSGTASSSTFLRGDSTFQTVNTDLVSDTSPQLGGNLDVNTKNITFGDSGSSSDDRLTFGASSDLEIFHDGSNSYVRETGTGSLFLEGNSTIYIGKASGGAENGVVYNVDGSVDLYYDNSKKLSTESDGIKIHAIEGGEAIITFFADEGDDATDKYRIVAQDSNDLVFQRHTGSGFSSELRLKSGGGLQLNYQGTKMIETISTGTNIPDGKFAKFGNSNDMSMGHNTYNYITYTGSDLLITGDATNQIKLMPKSDEAAIICKPNAEVELFHDGALQCETSANGLAFPNGKGIDFSAASGDGGGMQSELLADYEEGIYSPSLYRSSSSVSYLRNKGRYIRIGNMCFVWFDIQTSGNNSSGSGAWRVSLPFTFANNSTGTAGLNNAGHGAPSFRDMSFFTRDQGYKTSSYINGDYIELRYINASNTEQNMIETGSDGRVTGEAWGYLSQAT